MIWRINLQNHLARFFFTAAFGFLTAGTLAVGLRFGYRIDFLAYVQPIIPLFVGPCIYLGFRALGCGPKHMRQVGVAHLGIPFILGIVPLFIANIRTTYDLMIGLSYLTYCALLIGLWRRGPDSLQLAPLALLENLRRCMLFAAALLFMSFVFDTSIAVSFALGKSKEAINLISVGSFVSALSMIAAIVFFTRTSAPHAAPAPNVDSVHSELEQRASALLQDSHLYLDTNLTLDRLAKRLHVPTRQISEAINQTKGINVSQYVNGFRLRHAAQLLVNTRHSATHIMEQSGFLTRSNFYREFERVYGQSPLEYRKSQQGL